MSQGDLCVETNEQKTTNLTSTDTIHNIHKQDSCNKYYTTHSNLQSIIQNDSPYFMRVGTYYINLYTCRTVLVLLLFHHLVICSH